MQKYYEFIDDAQYEFIFGFNNSILFTDDRQYNILLIKTLMFQNDDVFIIDDYQYIRKDILKKMIKQMVYIFPIRTVFICIENNKVFHLINYPSSVSYKICDTQEWKYALLLKDVYDLYLTYKN